MFEEHFTNARNAGLKVGVYFDMQAVNEAEAQEEADGCNWALNGRMLDYPIFYDTEGRHRPAWHRPRRWFLGLRNRRNAPSPSASG